jgi:hypothetical protein
MWRRALRVGLGLLALGAVLVGLWALRQYQLHLEHEDLLVQEAARKPVAPPADPRRPAAATLAPTAADCISGVVLWGDAPAADVQVSASAGPRGRPADCPCTAPGKSASCDCPAALTELLQPETRLGLLDAVIGVKSGPDGQFSLCQLEGPQARTVWAEHADGRVGVSEDGFELKPGTSGVVLRLARLERVVGRVEDQGRAPIAGASVAARLSPPVRLVHAVTAADGTFSLDLPRGASLVAGAPGYVPQAAWANPDEPVVLRLSRPATLKVRVLRSERPVAGAQVVLNGSMGAESDADGWARFSGLGLGGGWAVARSERLIGKTRVTLQEGQESLAAIHLEPGAFLSGQVTSPAGPLGSALVRVDYGKVAVGPDGRFRSELLAPGAHAFSAEADGCAARDSREVQLGGDDVELAVALVCAPTLGGVLVDAVGAPVAGASLEVQCGATAVSGTSDAAGAFGLRAAPGTCQLTASKPGFKKHVGVVASPDTGLRVVMDAGASVSGRVLDSAGRGVARAEVLVLPALLEDLLVDHDRGSATGTTDPEGRFTVGGLAPGRIIVAATRPGVGRARSASFLLGPGEQKDGLVLTLNESASLTGRVVDEQGHPVSGARVATAPRDEKKLIPQLMADFARGDISPLLDLLPVGCVTGLDGTFSLKSGGIPDMKVEISASGFIPATQDVQEGDRVEVVLHPFHVLRVRGHVVDSQGGPLATFGVNEQRYYEPSGRFSYERTEADAHAHGQVKITAPGRTAVLRAVDGPDVDLGDIALDPGGKLLVVARDEAGRALAGVSVTTAPWSAEARTDAEGRCALSDLSPGKVKVTGQQKGRDAATAEVEVTSGDVPVELTLKAAAGSLSGHVYGAAGPIAGAEVRLSGSGSTIAGPDGLFQFDGLGAGTYQVSWEAGAGAGTAAEVVVGATPATVDLGLLPGGAALEGKVTAAAGPPPTGMVLALLGAGPTVSAEDVLSAGSRDFHAARSAWGPILGGRYALTGLAPGRWFLYVASVADLAGTLQPLATRDLAPGERPQVDLLVPAPAR